MLAGEPSYPALLARSGHPPPVLFYVGRIERVGRAWAICGGPEAGSAQALAAEAAGIAVAAGYCVVSGNAHGVEATVLDVAVERGGFSVAVLPEGIRHLRESPRSSANRLVISQFAPHQPWSVGAAMARNATIAGMSDALIAVGAGGVGGTLDAGLRALELRRPVVAVGDTPGSHLLVDYGAWLARDRFELAWWLGRLLDLPRSESAFA